MKPRDMTPEKCWSWSLVFAFFFQLPYAASKDCFHREGDWGRPLGLPLLIWTHSLVTSLTKVMFCCGHWYQTVGIVCVKLFVWMSKINTFLSKITTRAFICFVFLSDSKTQNTPHTTHKHKTQNTHTHHKTQNTTQNTKHKTHTHTNTTHTHGRSMCETVAAFSECRFRCRWFSQKLWCSYWSYSSSDQIVFSTSWSQEPGPCCQNATSESSECPCELTRSIHVSIRVIAGLRLWRWMEPKGGLSVGRQILLTALLGSTWVTWVLW